MASRVVKPTKSATGKFLAHAADPKKTILQADLALHASVASYSRHGVFPCGWVKNVSQFTKAEPRCRCSMFETVYMLFDTDFEKKT